MPQEFDPYHRWLGIQPEDQPANHYRLLGLSLFENDPEVVRDAAVQRMAHVRTYQLGKHQALSQQILNELAAAKTCLLVPESKAAYDLELQQNLSPAAQPAPDSNGHHADVIAKQRPSRLVWIAVAAGIAICLGTVALLPWIRPQQSAPSSELAAVAEGKTESDLRDTPQPVLPSPTPPGPEDTPKPSETSPAKAPDEKTGSDLRDTPEPVSGSPTPPAPTDTPKPPATSSIKGPAEASSDGASTSRARLVPATPPPESGSESSRPAKRVTSRSESVANALKKKVTLSSPYRQGKNGGSEDRISVQNAVKAIVGQVGLRYDFEASARNVGDVCKRYIYPDIRHQPCDAALKAILDPLGLSYEISGGNVVLKRR